ncbi:hypothetical protein GQ54DRAFT_189943 [Martensiomyces pterosporus]|nr:hypothetical protein GQ54DRAFT_189943 [Martensiomyces pterosporus]
MASHTFVVLCDQLNQILVHIGKRPKCGPNVLLINAAAAVGLQSEWSRCKGPLKHTHSHVSAGAKERSSSGLQMHRGHTYSRQLYLVDPAKDGTHVVNHAAIEQLKRLQRVCCFLCLQPLETLDQHDRRIHRARQRLCLSPLQQRRQPLDAFSVFVGVRPPR